RCPGLRMSTGSRRACPGSSTSSRRRPSVSRGRRGCWPRSGTTRAGRVSIFPIRASRGAPSKKTRRGCRAVGCRRANRAAAGAGLGGARRVRAPPLVGRDRDATAIRDLVVGEGVRLVTLTGPGGVGKSRLAVEVASRLGPGFADGARFADLTTVPAAELVAPTVAAALGLNTSGAEVISDVMGYLRSRRLLLVLDNFEQVMRAAPLVADLLTAARGLVVL